MRSCYKSNRRCKVIRYMNREIKRGQRIFIIKPLRVLEVHINDIMGISIHITESKIHISYLKHHDSTLMMSSIVFTCHSFQPSSISLLRVGNTFSISSPFDVSQLQKNYLDVSSTGSFPFPVSMDTHNLIPYHTYSNEDSTWI
jgi:hypothetical protein